MAPPGHKSRYLMENLTEQLFCLTLRISGLRFGVVDFANRGANRSHKASINGQVAGTLHPLVSQILCSPFICEEKNLTPFFFFL